MNKKSISEEDIKHLLEKHFKTEQLHQQISFNTFIQNLKKINSYKNLQEELFEQIYIKMSDKASSKNPSMADFPEIYLQALTKLDSKMESRRENISNIDQTLFRIKQDLKQLYELKKKGRIVNKAEVSSYPLN
jgi:hypothetical protein